MTCYRSDPVLVRATRRTPQRELSNSVGSTARRRAVLGLPLALAALLGGAAAEDTVPWTLDTEHRYVWLREGQKVGETRFRLEELPRDGGENVLVLTSRRSYDHQGLSQRSESTTVLSRRLFPIHFEETLHISALSGTRSRQDLRVDVKDGVATASWVHNGKTSKPTKDTVELPDDSFLHASQAVEHWALFLTALPPGAREHVLRLYYPDFGRVLEVTFIARSEEALRIGGQQLTTTLYEFSADILRGRAWRDDEGRLVQIEFPEAGLQVVLAPAPKRRAGAKDDAPPSGAKTDSQKDAQGE